MENISCIVCDDDNFIICHKIKYQSDEIFNLVKCNSCSFVYLNQRPDSTEIASYYGSEYKPHKEQQKVTVSFFKRISYFWKLFHLKKYVSTSRVHLDIGSGDGKFSQYLNKNKFSSFNYDPFSKKLNNSVDIDKKINSKYNLITLWHSIEHIHDIDGMLKRILRMLTPSGYVFIACPNYNSIDRKILKEKWVAFDVPRHLYHFDVDSMKKILKKYNFKIVKIHPMPQDTIFNIYYSLEKKISNIPKFIYLVFKCYFFCIFNKKSMSSYLYICKKL